MPNISSRRISLRVQQARLKEHRLKAQKQVRGLNHHFTMYNKYFAMIKNFSNEEYRELLNDPELVKRLEAALKSDYNRLSRSSRVLKHNVEFEQQPLPALPPEEINLSDEIEQPHEPNAGPFNSNH